MTVAYFLTHPIQYQSPLVRALCREGVDVRVVYGPDFEDWAAADPELGRVEPWDVPLLEGYPFERVDSWLRRGLLGVLALRRRHVDILRTMQPDAVWIHGWGDAHSVAAWIAAWQMGLPILLRGESHLGCMRGGSLRRWAHRTVLSRAFRTVTRFLAIGSGNRNFYLSYGVPAERIVNVPYAVENERFSGEDDVVAREAASWRQRLGIAEGDVVVGFSGKLKPSKRPHWLLKAVASITPVHLASKRPWLLFIGDGPWRRRLEMLARRLYPDRCLFLGFQNQSVLPALYRMMDLLVLPSRFEPWGLVVNEAMCAGTAVVASDSVGAAADLVEEGRTGSIFQTANFEDLERALISWLQDPTRLSQAGRYAAMRMQKWSLREDVAGVREALLNLPPSADGGETPVRQRHGVVAAYLGTHQVAQMAAAAAEVDKLEAYYCSVINLQGKLGQWLSQWFFIPSATPAGLESLPPERVREFPWPLFLQRGLERVRRGRRVDPVMTNSWFGTVVANRLEEHSRNAGIVIGAETCALELFRKARQLGLKRILDCHGIPTSFLQEGVERAAQEHGLPSPRLLDSPMMSARKESERLLADVMVLCSDLQKDIYVQSGLPQEKMRVVPLWVDTSFWTPVESRSTARGRPLRVLFVGAGSLAKGLPYLLAALDRLEDGEVELTLVGSVHAEMRPLLAQRRYKIAERPFCPRAELREFYRQMDVLVLPSLGDSFGFVAVEAMACALPVIVTDRCGAPLPAAAWRVPAFSADAIAERLRHYLHAPDLVREDGCMAAEFAQQFTSRRYREAIRSIFNELVHASLDRPA
jgi:glycosyltransferase involved in cell wall biosynthesis